jgi:hypothetical protein
LIQFARFLPAVKARGGRVILEVHGALLRLFELFAGTDAVRAIPELAPAKIDFDISIPLMSLGRRLRVTSENLSAPIPYLTADPRLIPAWQKRRTPGKYHIGIVWSGNPIQKTNHRRACSASHFEALAGIDDIQWCSLQKQTDSQSLRQLERRLGLDNWAADFKDFADTAAALHHLELIITTDTAVAHLAGAMGKAVWLLLCYFPDWRWALERPDCPWYPTMKLVRQPSPGNWDAVFQKVREMLLHLKKPELMTF